MDLRKVTIAPESDLAHEAFLVALPSASHLDVLVMKFSGTYGYGSRGNRDAEYMTAVTRAAISFTKPFALVFEFSELSYEWGDMMSQVLSSGTDRWINDEMPVAIVVSPSCEPSIRSLLAEEMDIEDLGLLQHTMADALLYVDARNKFSRSRGAG